MGSAGRSGASQNIIRNSEVLLITLPTDALDGLASSVPVAFLAGATLGVFLLWSEAIAVLVFGAAILVGLGLGAETDLMPYVVSRYFGLRAFGEQEAQRVPNHPYIHGLDALKRCPTATDRSNLRPSGLCIPGWRCLSLLGIRD
jgi:hypothetical protein